ncbi:MAG: acetolactate synthase small subunit [Planctomycetota bacterium]
MEATNKRIFSVLVSNKPGVLAHIAGLFSSRGYNIDSLAVGETEDEKLSRMTIVTHGDEGTLEQIRKQLSKLIDVIKLTDFASADFIERDLMLLKVQAPPEKRGEILEVINVFRGKVVDIARKHLVVEIAGPERKIEAFIALMRPHGIQEMTRTGRIALMRGD